MNRQGATFLRRQMKKIDVKHGEYSPAHKKELEYWKPKAKTKTYSEHIQKEIGGETDITKFQRPKGSQSAENRRYNFFHKPEAWGIDPKKLVYHERTNKSYVKAPIGGGYIAFPPIKWNGYWALPYYAQMPPDKTREQQENDEEKEEPEEEQDVKDEKIVKRYLKGRYEDAKRSTLDYWRRDFKHGWRQGNESFEKFLKRKLGDTSHMDWDLRGAPLWKKMEKHRVYPFPTFEEYVESWEKGDRWKAQRRGIIEEETGRSGEIDDYNKEKSRVGAHFIALVFHPEDMPDDIEFKQTNSNSYSNAIALAQATSVQGDEDEFKFPGKYAPELTIKTNVNSNLGKSNAGKRDDFYEEENGRYRYAGYRMRARPGEKKKPLEERNVYERY